MKAIVTTKYGSSDVLQLKEIEDPTPKDNEVRIKIYASTVTTGDCELRKFKMAFWIWIPLRLYIGIWKPRINILGQELAGVIDSVGKEVTQFKAGDSIFAPTQMSFGAHAEYICLPSKYVIALKPNNITFEEAATIPTGGLNALYFMRKANIQPGHKVLIFGAGGSIGTVAVQLAKSYGAEVTTVDSREKLDMLRTIGADHVIDYTKEDFTQNGEQYDAIFDVVGKSSYSRSVKSLKQSGRYLLGNPKLNQMIRGQWTSMMSTKNVMSGLASYKMEDLIHLKELIEAGTIKPVIDRRYPLEQMVDAHEYVEAGHKKGNVVITMGEKI